MNKLMTFINAKKMEYHIKGATFTYIVLPSEQHHVMENCNPSEFVYLLENPCFGGGILATKKNRYLIVTKEKNNLFSFREIDEENYKKTLDFITQPVL